LDILEDAWLLIRNDNLTLRVVGEGKIFSERLKTIASIRNEWLSSDDLLAELSESEILVLPYREASQSGLLPIAMRMGMKIVITPLPGLIEQTSKYPNVFVATNFESRNLASAIKRASRAQVVEIDTPLFNSEEIIKKFSLHKTDFRESNQVDS
jgi:hypothetical protein